MRATAPCVPGFRMLLQAEPQTRAAIVGRLLRSAASHRLLLVLACGPRLASSEAPHLVKESRARDCQPRSGARKHALSFAQSAQNMSALHVRKRRRTWRAVLGREFR